MSEKKSFDVAEEAEEGAPAWMVTFADLVTLLLTFFVLLLSFANTDAQKFKDMLGSLKDAFGVQEEEPGQFEERDRAVSEGVPNIIDLREREKLLFYQEIRRLIKREKLGGSTDLEMEKDGIRLRVKGHALFSSASAELSKDIYVVLDEIKKLMDKYEYTLVVEGHSDNIPIKSKVYPSNWELSASRAISVIRYFMEKTGASAKKLSAVGYADTRPLVPNNSPENRAKNRRVEFKFEQPLLKSYKRTIVQPKLIQLDIFERVEKKKKVFKQMQEKLLDETKDLK